MDAFRVLSQTSLSLVVSTNSINRFCSEEIKYLLAFLVFGKTVFPSITFSDSDQSEASIEVT